MYSGIATPVDKEGAANYYLLSAQLGNKEAQNNLGNIKFKIYIKGIMYEEGDGVPQNYEKAFYWYKEASKNVKLILFLLIN